MRFPGVGYRRAQPAQAVAAPTAIPAVRVLVRTVPPGLEPRSSSANASWALCSTFEDHTIWRHTACPIWVRSGHSNPIQPNGSFRSVSRHSESGSCRDLDRVLFALDPRSALTESGHPDWPKRSILVAAFGQKRPLDENSAYIDLDTSSVYCSFHHLVTKQGKRFPAVIVKLRRDCPVRRKHRDVVRFRQIDVQ
jgi:hypothetical protein